MNVILENPRIFYFLVVLLLALYYYTYTSILNDVFLYKLCLPIMFKYGWEGVSLSPMVFHCHRGKPVAVAPTPPSEPPAEHPPASDPGAIPSPLEQFEIIPLFPMNIGDFDLSFTNPSFFMLLTLSLVLLLLYLVTKKGGGKFVPNAWQSLVELLYDFVLNLVNEQIGGLSGNVKQQFFPCISVTFTFSLFRNPQGMIPYSFTVTSHFIITLGLSFSIFIGITIVGFQRNGLHFVSFLLPAGVPLPLAPFLVLLELIPHCFRALSSGIRLFANMMAGHSSVKILSGSAWTMLCMNDLCYFIGDPGLLFIVLALTGLEWGVAILQAYVSTILICIYLNDATNLHQSGFLFIIEQKRVSLRTPNSKYQSSKCLRNIEKPVNCSLGSFRRMEGDSLV
nr:ATPase subunit 6 [Ombrophytum subterraneum]